MTLTPRESGDPNTTAIEMRTETEKYTVAEVDNDRQDLVSLFCAAPDLLKACKDAMLHALTCRELPEFSDGFVISKDNYQAIVKAIDKAEGRKS